MSDRDTHVERINPPVTPAPAFGPRDRGEKKPYRMLTKGTHDGILIQPSQTVWLYDDEVGAQHAALTPEQAAAQYTPPPPVTVVDPRDTKIGELQAQIGPLQLERDQAALRALHWEAECNDALDLVQAKTAELDDLRRQLDEATKPDKTKPGHKK